MTSSPDPARTVPATGLWEGFGQWSRALGVPVTASAGAALGVVIGYVMGDALLINDVIEPGSSTHMAPAVVVGAALLAAFMVSLQDPFEDPRMFRLHRLIWIDAGLATVTFLLLAVRRWAPVLEIAALTVAGAATAALAVSQFLPFIADCAPVRSGTCPVGY